MNITRQYALRYIQAMLYIRSLLDLTMSRSLSSLILSWFLLTFSLTGSMPLMRGLSLMNFISLLQMMMQGRKNSMQGNPLKTISINVLENQKNIYDFTSDSDETHSLRPQLPVQDRKGGRLEGKCHGLGCTWQRSVAPILFVTKAEETRSFKQDI